MSLSFVSALPYLFTSVSEVTIALIQNEDQEAVHIVDEGTDLKVPSDLRPA